MASGYLQPDYPSDSFRIRRKPVSNPNLRATYADQREAAASSPSLVLPSQPPSYTDLYGPAPISRSPSPVPIPRPRTAGPTASPAPPPPTSVQKAYGEARHFLGGLINHPTESNKH